MLEDLLLLAQTLVQLNSGQLTVVDVHRGPRQICLVVVCPSSLCNDPVPDSGLAVNSEMCWCR